MRIEFTFPKTLTVYDKTTYIPRLHDRKYYKYKVYIKRLPDLKAYNIKEIV